jgi:1-deoxyxylulose-5-phosphate synthase
LALCADQGIGVVPWSPLARGRLARAWEDEPSTVRGGSDPWGDGVYAASKVADKAVVDRVGEVAARLGVPRAQVALAWLLHQPVVTVPIVGATRPHHLEEAVAALSVSLPPAEIAALEAPYAPHAVAGID